MTDHKEYEKAVNFLRKNRPVLHNKARLVDNVLNQTHAKRTGDHARLYQYFFGWTSVGWIRNSLATAAALLLGFFIIQQALLNKRFNQLEQQIVRTINGAGQGDSKAGIKEKVLMNLLTSQSRDSITISTSDLNTLIEAFVELRESQKENNRPMVIGSYNKRFLKKSLEEELKNKASKQNL